MNIWSLHLQWLMSESWEHPTSVFFNQMPSPISSTFLATSIFISAPCWGGKSDTLGLHPTPTHFVPHHLHCLPCSLPGSSLLHAYCVKLLHSLQCKVLFDLDPFTICPLLIFSPKLSHLHILKSVTPKQHGQMVRTGAQGVDWIVEFYVFQK